jgi:hypothetical protein
MNPTPAPQDGKVPGTAARPDDFEQVHRRLVLFDLAEDIELGYFLAYYRNFAIPRIAETLVRNGEIPARPMKRSYDTGIVIYELISCGLDSERGRQMVALLNRVHRNVPGTAEDFRYVLLTLLVVPIRWTRKHAWRRPTATEVRAAVEFYANLSRRLRIPGFPAGFASAEALFDAYEAAHVQGSEAGKLLMGSTLQALKNRLPGILGPVTPLLLSCMLDDARLASALGLPASRLWSRVALTAGLRVRNLLFRRRAVRTEPYFRPGQSMPAVYPQGYRLSDVGPRNVYPG